MSAALVWIFLPLAVAVGLWIFRQRENTVNRVATLVCLGLAGLAWIMPIAKAVHIGPLLLELDPQMSIAGRHLVINDSDRPLLLFLYIIAAFWFAGISAAGGNRFIAPNGMGVVALLIGALAVQPFLYSALLVETAVLLSVPMLVPPGSPVSQGVLRYLLFQTLAMPFVILAGWALTGVEANPADANLVVLAGIFLGLGFAFWLAIFPFYTWLPLLSGQAHPYAVGFLYLMLPTASLLLGLDFMNAYGWLRNSPELYLVLRLSGTLMVGTAGMLAAFQRDLGRLFGYAVIVETGFSLLAISLNNRLGQEIFTMMFLPRMIALGLWALSASTFLKAGLALRYEDLARVAEHLPVASAGLAAAYLSIAGLPLLAAFPNRQVLLQEIAVHSPFAALWVLVGTLGMLFSGFRLLAVLTGGYFGPRKLNESRTQIFLMVVGVAALVLIGVFPRLFLPMLIGLLKAFTRLPG